MESGQELLPGIPDEITIKDIATRLKWETSNVMQMVSRKWRHAICSRSVYDARVLSDSTEAFLVLAYFFNGCNKRGLTLYSCVDGTFLRLLPIPGATDTCTHPSFDCICLDGRVYLWEPADFHKEPPVLWVLDLAGDRRWTIRERVKCWRPTVFFKIGTLDGKLYRFRGNTRVDHGVLEKNASPDIRQVVQLSNWSKLEYLPRTEVYDMHSNVWSYITPERPVAADARCVDLESHLTVFSEWERKQLQTDPSKTIRRYEPFYSEWRTWFSTTGAVEKSWCQHHALATQVYHTNCTFDRRNDCRKTYVEISFCRENLVKVIQPIHRRRPLGVDIQTYDTEKETWELCKSFPAPHGCFDGRWVGHIANGPGIQSCIFVANVIWALVAVRCLDWFDSEVCLMKHPLLLDGEVNNDSVGWINTSFSMVQFNPAVSVLRPIYL